MMKVILFGTGAMSCLFAARLSQIADVAMTGTWQEGIETIRTRGILFEDAGESRLVHVKAEPLGAPVAPADLAIILVKSWQTKSIAAYLDRYMKTDGLAVSLQNGLGNLELLGSRASPGTTAEGATLLAPGHVRAGGSGATYMVAPERVVELFRSAGLETYACSASEAESLVWGKLCVSCGINALTAILQVPNGELLRRPSAKDLMIRAAEECADVARAKGIRLPYPDPAMRVTEVAERTATNKSSMLQDILRGAPTECDAIQGAVSREGKQKGVPTPVNDVLWQLIRAAAHPNWSESDSCEPRKTFRN